MRALPGKLGACLLAAQLCVGCAQQYVTPRRPPGATLDRSAEIYVVRDDSDARSPKLEPLIVDALRRRGLKASGGAAAGIPRTAEVVARYDCQWQWDLTWYLLELRIALYERPADLLIASGHSRRTSLVREAPEVMAAEVVEAMLDAGKNP